MSGGFQGFPTGDGAQSGGSAPGSFSQLTFTENSFQGFLEGGPATIAGVELSDGSADLMGVAKLTVSGATVGGTAAAATLTIAAGGGGQTTMVVSADTTLTDGDWLVIVDTPTAGADVTINMPAITATARTITILKSGFDVHVVNIAVTTVGDTGWSFGPLANGGDWQTWIKQGDHAWASFGGTPNVAQHTNTYAVADGTGEMVETAV